MDEAQFEQVWRVLQEEYKTVRDESKQAEINTFTALQWGATLVVFAAGAGLTQWGIVGRDAVVVSAFTIFIPLFGLSSFYVWLGEVLRIQRAGNYLFLLEQKVATLIPTSLSTSEWTLPVQRKAERAVGLTESEALIGLLNFESWLRQTRRDVLDFNTRGGHEPITQLPRFFFFPVVTLLSWCVGTYYWWYHMASSEPPRRIPFVGWPFVHTLVYGMLITIVLSLSYGMLLAWYQFRRK